MEWFINTFLQSFLDRGLGDKNHELTITKKQEDIFYRYCNMHPDARFPFSDIGKAKDFTIMITPIPNSTKYSHLMIWK